MLLSYLVTSRARRKLLRLLWGAAAEGNVSELGRRAEEPGARSPSPPPTVAEKVRSWLSAAGAPLLASRPAAGPLPPLEQLLAEGLALSHRDAGLARVLPLVLWLNRGRLGHHGLVPPHSLRN